MDNLPKLERTEAEMQSHRKAFVFSAAAFQGILIVLFAWAAEYGQAAKAKNTVSSQAEIDHLYPFYQDVHVMIFIGFGFLMTFLKKYGFSSVGYNFLIATLCIQWSMLTNHFWHSVHLGHFHKLNIGIENLITSDFAAGAVLITFGGVLGKTSPLQMLLVVIFEMLFYGCNEMIGAVELGAVDMGGSIFVHTFGAYFGLALSWTISRSKSNDGSKGVEDSVIPRPLNSSNYNSDLFAMIGTIFLWMFWPSFNGALATESQQHRVVINTVLSLSAGCVSAFCADALVRKDNKFDMVSIQNATLAAGVAVGSSSDLVIQPWGALTVGVVAGAWSVLGYVYVQPFLERCIGLDDTCGINNLHGMPGIIGAVGGAISAMAAGDTLYGANVGTVFPRRAPVPPNATAAEELQFGLSASDQMGVQFAALGITLGISIVGGIITGIIIKTPCLLPPGHKAPWCKLGQSSSEHYWYQDHHYWEVPENDDDEDDEQVLISKLSLHREQLDGEIARLLRHKENIDNYVSTNDIELGSAVSDKAVKSNDSEKEEVVNDENKNDEA